MDKHYSCEKVSNKKGISESNIRRRVSFYREYGKIGLMARKNQVYSINFKLKVLQCIDRDSLSLRETRLRFNIPSDSIIVRRKKDFSTFGIEGLQPQGRAKSMNTFKRKKRKSDKPLTTEEELLKANESLRCENDYLKKLQALIQSQEKSNKRKS